MKFFEVFSAVKCPFVRTETVAVSLVVSNATIALYSSNDLSVEATMVQVGYITRQRCPVGVYLDPLPRVFTPQIMSSTFH